MPIPNVFWACNRFVERQRDSCVGRVSTRKKNFRCRFEANPEECRSPAKFGRDGHCHEALFKPKTANHGTDFLDCLKMRTSFDRIRAGSRIQEQPFSTKGR